MPQSTPRRWTPQEEAILRESAHLSHQEIANLLGRSRTSIRQRCYELKIVRHQAWSEDDLSILRAAYEAVGPDSPLDLTSLSARLGRDRSTVCGKARDLGLTRQGRPHDDESTARLGEIRRAWHRDNAHPRGALGMKHTPEARERMREALQRHAEQQSAEQRAASIEKGITTKLQRYGTGRPGVSAENAFSSAQGGRAEDLGSTYYRSSWERNYARYLNWLVAQGQIKSWRYEAVTFWFEEIKQGVRSWKPDFEITNLDDSLEYHEVKGYDYPRGKTARQRMAKYHPTVKVVLVGEDEYREIAKWKAMIPDWETPRKKPPPQIESAP